MTADERKEGARRHAYPRGSQAWKAEQGAAWEKEDARPPAKKGGVHPEYEPDGEPHRHEQG